MLFLVSASVRPLSVNTLYMGYVGSRFSELLYSASQVYFLYIIAYVLVNGIDGTGGTHETGYGSISSKEYIMATMFK